MPVFMKVTLRLPLSVHRAVSKAAEESGQSLNAEIVSRLNASLGNPYLSEKDANDDVLYRLAEVEARITQLENQRSEKPTSMSQKRPKTKTANGDG